MDLVTLAIGVVIGVVFAVPITAFYKNSKMKVKEKLDSFDK
jgi:uncharacterized membrane protein